MGRPKGSRNKASSYARVILDDHGCNPLLDTLRCANLLFEDGQIKEAGALYKDLIPYCAAKLSAIEVSSDEESPLSISVSIGGANADNLQ